MMMAQQELMTVREAAARLHLPEGRIRDWIHRKLIATYKPAIGRGLYVDATEIEEKRTPRKRD